MQTDTPPILEMIWSYLTGHADIVAALASIGVAIAIAASIAVNVKLSNRSMKQTEKHAKRAEEHVRQTEEHEEHIRKTVSADLVLRLKQRYHDYNFKEVAAYLDDAKERDPNRDEDVERLLHHAEYIAILWYDNVLTTYHVQEMFGGLVLLIRNNDIAQAVMEELHRQDPDYYYKHLKYMLDKI